VLTVVVVAATGGLPPDAVLDRGPRRGGDEGDATVADPPPSRLLRAVIVLGVVAACAFALEGAMADWSAIYLHDHLGASAGVAALGFVAFAVGMTASRFLADRVVTDRGSAPVVRIAGIGGVIGVVIVVAAPAAPLAIAGFLVVGVSFAPVVPVAFRAGGQGPGGHHRLAWVVTIGYLGTVAGPVVIGSVTTATSLRAGLGVLVVLGATVAIAAPATRRADVVSPAA
jgi:MFS family permease